MASNVDFEKLLEDVRNNAITKLEWGPQTPSSELEPISLAQATQLAKALKDNTSIVEINFKRSTLSGPIMEELAPAFGQMKQLEEIRIAASGLTDDDMALLAPQAAKLPRLGSFLAYDNPYTDQGVAHVVNALKGHPCLTQVNFNGIVMKDDGIRACQTLLEETPSIVYLAMDRANGERSTATSIWRVAENNAENLIELFGPNGRRITIDERRDAALEVAEYLRRKSLDQWDITSFIKAHQLRHVIYFNERPTAPNQRIIPRLDDFQDALPLPPIEEINWETLTSRGDAGYCALDNPLFWENFEEIAAALEAKGTPLTKAQLLTTNREVLPFLVVGMLCGKLDLAARHLQTQGDSLAPDDFLTEDGQANELYCRIIEKGLFSELFTGIDWEEQGLPALQDMLHALSAEEVSSIPNLPNLRNLAPSGSHSAALGR